MEKLVQVPFSVDMAKRIQSGEVEGRIVTRDGRSARIICWDRRNNKYPIIALLDKEEEEFDEPTSLTSRGTYYIDTETGDDLLLEIPEYLTFKDGDIFKTSDGSIGIYNANYTPMYGLAPYYAGLRYADKVLCFCQGNGFGFGALRECTHDVTETEKQKLIEALKASEEPKAKEYLKRFFGIEHSNSSKIGKDCEFEPTDWVLVRNYELSEWWLAIFSHTKYDSVGNRIVYGCTSGGYYKYCIPYNDSTKHLLGTTDNQ